MSKEKISVLTKIVIILTISVIPMEIMGRIGGLIFILALLFGIGGIIAAIKNKNSNGIIICILCILLNLSFLYFLPEEGVAREPAKRISCASNIKQIYIALKQYAADYSGNFPPESGAAGLEYLRKYDYISLHVMYICPSTKTVQGTNNQPLTEQTVDYVYVGGLNEKSDPNTPILYDKTGNHQDFSNTIAVDGTVNNTPEKQWMERFKK